VGWGFWNILLPASPDRLAAIKDPIAAVTWVGRIVLDEPRHILQMRVGDWQRTKRK